MNAVIYIRVSSDEQVNNTSLETQEQICRDYCEKRGWTDPKVFREEGESAKDLRQHNRKQLLAVLEFCRKAKGMVEHFVVYKLDRFSRKAEDHFAIRKVLAEYHVSLHSATEPTGDTPPEKLLETMLAGFAEFDNAIRRERSTNGMMQRVKQGIRPVQPPLGYACQHCKKRGQKKTEPDPPDPITFPILQAVLKECARGVITRAQMPARLDTLGLARARGRKTTPQIVDRIVNHNLKYYAGILINPWTGEEVEGRHVPMITKDDLYNILAIQSGKARIFKYDVFNPAFPLRRTIVCQTCGRPLTASAPRGNGGRYFYYHCANKACSEFGRAFPKKIVEKEFANYLETITPKKRFLAVFEESVLDTWEEKGMNFKKEAKVYESKLAELETRKQRVYDMREDGSYTKEDFLERKQRVEQDIVAAKVALNETATDQFDMKGALSYATNFAGNLGRRWFKLVPQLRPRFQKLVFPEGVPYARTTGFGTAKLGCIFEMNRHYDGDASRLVHGAGFEPA